MTLDSILDLAMSMLKVYTKHLGDSCVHDSLFMFVMLIQSLSNYIMDRQPPLQ